MSGLQWVDSAFFFIKITLNLDIVLDLSICAWLHNDLILCSMAINGLLFMVSVGFNAAARSVVIIATFVYYCYYY
jgi:hypothetical protein